jgi:hypothetical protein
MESIKLITKEEFARVLLDYSVSFNDRLTLVREEFQIEIPNTIQDGQVFLDCVYDKYLQLVEEYNLNTKIPYVPRKKENPDENKKEFIIQMIFDKKSIMYDDLYEIVDKKFEYWKYGKSPRTRIRKVLQKLEAEKLIRVLPIKEGKLIEVIK